MKHNLEKNARPVLRLIKGGEPPVVVPPPMPAEAPKLEAPKSALLSFMRAYADAVERDVRLILEV
jgi:hypothetical protein